MRHKFKKIHHQQTQDLQFCANSYLCSTFVSFKHAMSIKLWTPWVQQQNLSSSHSHVLKHSMSVFNTCSIISHRERNQQLLCIMTTAFPLLEQNRSFFPCNLNAWTASLSLAVSLWAEDVWESAEAAGKLGEGRGGCWEGLLWLIMGMIKPQCGILLPFPFHTGNLS